MKIRISFARFFLAVLIMFQVTACLTAQSANVPFKNITADSHTGSITSLTQDKNGNIISAGEDGFINLWNVNNNASEDRFQLSPYPIISMAKRPNKNHVAIIESDRMGLYRISAWDYVQKKKLFTLRITDPVSYITYSKNGGFLIAARNGRTGVVFINPENGELLQAPSNLSGTITFAATGQSERTMIVYSPLGTLSYWNLENGTLMQSANVPQNITSPLLFNNNVFFAGIDKGGLVVLDALSGRELSRNSSIKSGRLFAVSEESSDLICIQNQNGIKEYFLFRMNSSGQLRTISHNTIPENNGLINSSILLKNRIALGTADGKINLYDQQTNQLIEMQTYSQFKINEIAASHYSLAILNDANGLAFIPADYNLISADTIIHFEELNGFDQIVASNTVYNNEEIFVLWKSGDAKTFPVIRGKTEIIAEVKQLSDRYPIHVSSILNNLILFMDTGGTISIYNLDTKQIEYQHNAAGALYASFIDDKNIIVARIADGGSSPFLMLNITTGETVPLAYPADIGTRTYVDQNGMIYGAVVNQDEDEFITRIINIDTSNPAASRSIIEYQDEDTAFSVAECGGQFATTLGGDGAALFSQQDFRPFERSAGLPIKLTNINRYFTVLDSTGSIIWHNPSTGKIEAILRIYDDKWYLQKNNSNVLLEGFIQ
jgi:WD40 repeat protein